jgi:hypothetical protein
MRIRWTAFRTSSPYVSTFNRALGMLEVQSRIDSRLIRWIALCCVCGAPRSPTNKARRSDPCGSYVAVASLSDSRGSLFSIAFTISRHKYSSSNRHWLSHELKHASATSLLRSHREYITTRSLIRLCASRTELRLTARSLSATAATPPPS